MLNKEVILIVGVGRSGTSALTRVLSLCGCALPESVLGSTDMNLKGTWEPIEIWKLNAEFLLRHNTVDGDPTMRLQDSILDENEKESYIDQVRSFLRKCPQGPVLVKHPTISEVMELWLDAIHRSGFSAKIIVPIRHPQEVCASLARMYRINMSMELGNAYWIRRNLLAERHSRNFPRVFVEHASFMQDWRTQVSRVSKALSIDLEPDDVAIDDFLAPHLHREHHSGPVVETFGCSWTSRVYAILSSAAQDRSIDLPALDEIYHAYRATERAFRIAGEEFRERVNSISHEKFREALNRAPIFKSGADF